MDFVTCLWDIPYTAPETIARLAFGGVSAIEPEPDFLFENDDAALAEAGIRFTEAGIRVYSCHAPFGTRDDLSDADPASRAGTLNRHRIAIERTAEAGGSVLVIHPSTKIPEKDRPLRREMLNRSLETLIPAAEKAGLVLALENMLKGQLCDRSHELLEIIEYFDSPVLGACFDTGHFHVTGEGVADAFAVLSERIIHFHLQDNDTSRDLHLQPPYGTIDWHSFIDAVKQKQYDFPFTVEAFPWNGGTWKDLLREIRALFDTGILTIQLDGREVRMMCRKCGRYCFGTADNWFCGCSS
jgi:sugar phosphate isomerase/epimerase